MNISGLKDQFKERTGYELNLQNPRTYCEKIQWRKVYDRRPLLPNRADKIAARDVVESILGAEYLVPSPYSCYGEPLIEDVESTMLAPCVIKANHGCGWMIFQGAGGVWLDAAEIKRRAHDWIGRTYGVDKFLWAESQIVPGMIVESPMVYKGGQPVLVKLYVFDGVARMGNVIEHGRHTVVKRSRPKTDTWHARDGKVLDLHLGHIPATQKLAPAEYAQCVKLSEECATGIDHVRVDWMLTDEGVKFSEFTWHPTNGMFRLKPAKWDRIMGDWWTLPKEIK